MVKQVSRQYYLFFTQNLADLMSYVEVNANDLSEYHGALKTWYASWRLLMTDLRRHFHMNNEAG